MNDADNLDLAAELQDRFNRRGIAAAQETLRAQTHPDFDGKHCFDCADVIAPQRLASGRMRCTDCESIVERRNRRYL
jgi:hypothetical protein